MRAGLVAVGGRPNVGKSTLFNCLLGPKLSIVSRRRQTTRFCIRGVLTEADTQFVFVDTPGWQCKDGGLINRSLNAAAEHALPYADAGVLVLAGRRLQPDDRRIAEMFPPGMPVIAILNKIDLVKQRDSLLPQAEQLSSWRDFAAIIPASALTGENVDILKDELRKLLPEGEPLYPPEQLSDRDDAFFLADMIRERIFGLLGAELPYHAAVIIRKIVKKRKTKGITLILADIIVDTESRRAMFIGAGGQMLKRIGSTARPVLEDFLQSRVHLELYVRVKRGWMSQPAELSRLGITP